MTDFERNVEDVVECLRLAQNRNTKCSLLIGAGCSVSAKIPTAGQFVEEIRKRYPEAYRRATAPKGYPQCMKELAPGIRRTLIGEFVDKAGLNWAHLAIAQLMKHGYVDRILTTNFDPLILRACNLVGVFPSVYDFAASKTFQASMVESPAVYFLHGQRSGFVLLNTQEALDAHFETLRPVFSDAGHGRAWLVVGYSGECDPVFNHLTQIDCFNEELYWITNGNKEPKSHVKEELLKDDKYAFYVKSSDADSFFCELADKLGCFPPVFAAQPFTYLLETMVPVLDYAFPGSKTPDKSLMEYPRKLVRRAIEDLEGSSLSTTIDITDKALSKSAPPNKPITSESAIPPHIAARLALWQGDLDRALELTDPILLGSDQRLRDVRADIFSAYGNDLYSQGLQLPKAEALSYFEQAIEKYQQALAINPNDSELFNNWGITIAQQARCKKGVEAQMLWEQSIDKYQQALALSPEAYETLNNWGITLNLQAKQKEGADANALWEQAYEKYQQSLSIKPDNHDVLNNWGAALSEQAKCKVGLEANALWEQAYEKYQQSLAIKPDNYETLNNWGVALIEQAKDQKGQERLELFNSATEKLLNAEQLKPGSGSYNLACIAALQNKEHEVKQWLEKCLEYDTLPAREDMEKDADLNNLRNQAWFQELLQKAKL